MPETPAAKTATPTTSSVSPAWTQNYKHVTQPDGREILYAKVDGYHVWAQLIGDAPGAELPAYQTNGVILPQAEAGASAAGTIRSNDNEFARELIDSTNATTGQAEAPWRPLCGPGVPDLNSPLTFAIVIVGTAIVFKVARRMLRR